MTLGREYLEGHSTNLRFNKDSTEAVKKLKRGDHVALNQSTCKNCCHCPPPRANRHLPKPRLEGQSPTVHDLIHDAWLTGLEVVE